MFCNTAIECRHSGTNLCSQLSDDSKNVENYVRHAEKLMDIWEVETSKDDREAAVPLVISLEGISGEKRIQMTGQSRLNK